MTIEHAVPADQAADLIRQLYRAYLGREPNETDLAIHSEYLRLNGAMSALSGIIYSPEAVEIRARADGAARARLPNGMLAIDRADVAEVVSRALTVGRRDAPSSYEVELRVDDFDRGNDLATVLQDALQASQNSGEDAASIDRTIGTMYRLALGRTPGPVDFEYWRNAAGTGGRLSELVSGIGESAEAKLLLATLDMVPGVMVQLAFEIVLGRGATAAEVEHFRAMVDQQGLNMSVLVWRLFSDEAKKRLLPPSQANNPQQAYIFGSRGLVNITDWEVPPKREGMVEARHNVLGSDSVVALRPAEKCVVSIITSLYRGGSFIRSFLENITSQTIFSTHCELIIVDANSPEGEHVVIEEYCQRFPNILYKRTDSRVGIYEAWNIAIELASGLYITNANLDDIRRNDSLQIQASILDSFEFVDVAYQDVLYTFEPRIAFEKIAQREFRSDLPIVSKYNLMEFNSPHNAPMWRAALHRDVGLFNQSLQSAADFEFWLRCRRDGKIFYKVNEAHVAYFVNPEGISTRPDTRGLAEANSVSRELYREIVSPMLVISEDDFLARVDEIDAAPLRKGRRYDIVQSALLALGTRREGAVA